MKINVLYHRAMSVAASLVVTIGALCQTAPVTHVIQKGETIQSIAARYSTTPQAIIQLNPEAGEFTYVGMELKIPAATTQSVESATTVSTAAVAKSTTGNTISYKDNTDPVGTLISPTVGSTYKANDTLWPTSSWGISYIANFSNNGKGFYGFYSEILNEHGFGVYLYAGANYGIVKEGNLLFRAGPNYGCMLSDNIMLSCPLALNVGTYNHVNEIYEYRGKQNTKEDMKTAFGLSFNPTLGFNIDNKAHLSIGLDLNYFFEQKYKTFYKDLDMTMEMKYNGKAYIGFTVALGFIMND